MKHLLSLTLALLLIGTSTQAASNGNTTAPKPPPLPASENFFRSTAKPDQIIPYKTVGNTTLSLHLFKPANFKPTDKRPCLLAIHGGGWSGSSPAVIYSYAKWGADQGFVAISVQYRLLGKTAPTVFDCVRDVRSALRYVREHASTLGIDPDKIITIGNSAGGHLALAPLLFKFDDPSDNLGTSTSIAAAIVISPVIDTSPEGYGSDRIKPDWRPLSPLHNLVKNLPPILILHGTADPITPYSGSVKFTEQSKALGNPTTLITYPEGIHSHTFKSSKDHKLSLQQIQSFLQQNHLFPSQP